MGSENFCTLNTIDVGTHESNPTLPECTDCNSFVKRNWYQNNTFADRAYFTEYAHTYLYKKNILFSFKLIYVHKTNKNPDSKMSKRKIFIKTLVNSSNLEYNKIQGDDVNER